MGKPHALVIPFPAQGHVIPLLEFSHCLIERGFHVTFVNTESTHSRISATLLAAKVGQPDEMKMVAIPDGMEHEEDRRHLGKLCDSILASMPSCLEELVGKLNESEANKVTCIVADASMGWAVDIALKKGISSVAIWTAAAAFPLLIDRISELIENGIMDDHGVVANHQMIQLSTQMPVMNTKDFMWLRIPADMQRPAYHYLVSMNNLAKKAKYRLCNSFHEIEHAVFDLAPYLGAVWIVKE